MGGTCKYANPDSPAGEELTFTTATGTFSTESVLENVHGQKGTLEIVWKLMGKKKAMHTVELEYGPYPAYARPTNYDPQTYKMSTEWVYHPRKAVELEEEE